MLATAAVANALNVVIRRRWIKETDDFEVARWSLNVDRGYAAGSTVTPALGVVLDTVRASVHSHPGFDRLCRHSTSDVVLLFL